MHTLFVSSVQRLYQVSSFSTEVVRSFFVYGQSLSKFLSSAQRLYQSSISLNLTGSVTSVWVWSIGRWVVLTVNNPTAINKSHYPLHPRTVRSHPPSTERSGHTNLFYPSIHPETDAVTPKRPNTYNEEKWSSV